MSIPPPVTDKLKSLKAHGKNEVPLVQYFLVKAHEFNRKYPQLCYELLHFLRALIILVIEVKSLEWRFIAKLTFLGLELATRCVTGYNLSLPLFS